MLVLFRPEEKAYGTSTSNEYGYTWQHLQQYLSFLINDNKLISKLRLYAMHNMTHCAKQNRKAQKLLTKFRHRDRDLWSDEEKTTYASMQLEERSRNAQHSEHSRETEEFSQEPLPYATIRQYQMQIDHCNQLKNSLNTFHGGADIDRPSLLQQQNSVIMPSTTLSFGLVQSVQTHITRSNEYFPESDGHENNDNNNFDHTSSEIDVHHYDDMPYDDMPDTASISHNMNVKQLEVYNIMKGFIDSPTHENVNAPYIVLLGGPGTGKSYVVKCLQQYVSATKPSEARTVVTCSNFGLPAVLIEGQTIYSLLKLNTDLIKETENEVPQLSATQLAETRSKLKRTKVLVIDEISTVTAPLLYAINIRLRQIFSSNRLFGGIAILALGDLMQLGPVGGSNVAISCVDYSVNIHRRYTRLTNEKYRPESIWTKGTQLFGCAKVMKLTEQQRAVDDVFHTDVIKKLHSGNTFSKTDLKKYKILSSEDMTGEAHFRFATILVSSNRERIDISYTQLKQYALFHGIPIVKWKSKHKNWRNSPSDIESAIAADCAFYEYFCVDLPGFLTQNIANNLKLANGTPIKLKTIQFNCINRQNAFIQEYNNAAPGDEICLDYPPDFLTYIPYPEDEDFHRQWIHKNWPTLDESKQHVLLVLPKSSSNYNKYKTYPIQGNAVDGPSSVQICPIFSFQMGFAQTLHKGQGRTIPYVILSLQNVRGCINFSQIFVAFTRVANHNNIRLLLPHGTNHDVLSYIANLEPDGKILTYLKCLDENDKFDSKWVAEYEMNRKMSRRNRRRRL